LTDTNDLESAFDSTLSEVRKALARGMLTASGQSAQSKLETLESELRAERARATEKGVVDRGWFQGTMKWLVGWLPESELTLIAALGRIARVKPKRIS
jgi:hypothetical protein